MLSYRHAFHAGNYADILKHTTLTLILDSLLKKDKPFTVIDTHAGAGLYDLTDSRALKTLEAQNGILSLLSKCGLSSTNNLENTDNQVSLTPLEIPESLKLYLNLVTSYTNKQQYPGSPLITLNMMRESDRLVLAELHNTEIEILKSNMYDATSNAHLEIFHKDGFDTLLSLVPPPMRRGLVLIDPSYETDDDWSRTGEEVSRAHKKWQTGIYAVWYPLLDHRKLEISTLKNRLRIESENIPQKPKNSQSAGQSTSTTQNGSSGQSGSNTLPNESRILFAELCSSNPTADGRLYGSGMCVINPPWKLDEKLNEILPFLAKASGDGGSFSLER